MKSILTAVCVAILTVVAAGCGYTDSELEAKNDRETVDQSEISYTKDTRPDPDICFAYFKDYVRDYQGTHGGGHEGSLRSDSTVPV